MNNAASELGGHGVKVRRPRSEGRKKAETRRPKPPWSGLRRILKFGGRTCFGFRPSALLRLSAFGLRVWNANISPAFLLSLSGFSTLATQAPGPCPGADLFKD